LLRPAALRLMPRVFFTGRLSERVSRGGKPVVDCGQANSQARMQIDVISDTICPWCYIGKRRLDRALALRPTLDFDIHWRAFLLDPAVPPEGIDRAEYFAARFGDSAPPTLDAVIEAGDTEGIRFAFDKIARVPNTLDSHRLIRWSASAGATVQDTVVNLLFKCYFEEAADIGDCAVLVGIAEAAGMDPTEVAALLASDEDMEAVQEEDALARAMGVGGVPCFLINRKYALMGAQDPDRFLTLFDQIAARGAVGV
jgi:predicted DsbA family dithiol-disulfide isomerase